MTDYKRMVSYMYQYENGIKKKNVGYVRVEAKNGQCKFTINMQLLGQSDSIFPTYLIHRDEKQLELVYLGDSILKTQVMDSRLLASENNIMDSGYSLKDMSGILIFLNNNIFFATVWDDNAINADELLDAMKPKQKKNVKSVNQYYDSEPAVSTMNSAVVKLYDEKKDTKKVEIEEKTKLVDTKPTEELPYIEEKLSLEEELKIPKYKFPRGFKTIEMFRRSIAIADKINGSDDDNFNEVQVEGAFDQAQKHQEESSADRIEEQQTDYNDEQATEQQADFIYEQAKEQQADRSFEQGAEQLSDISTYLGESHESEVKAATKDSINNDLDSLFDQYNRLYPFEDNEILLCVKIEPKDIGKLPKELWSLSNNSFLLHGFYCYHHLILAKMKYKDKAIYILGVPGLYHNREQFMARMFGFDSFKPIKKRELRKGDFGYWYLQINF